MKKFLLIVAVLICAIQLPAQTNETVRLALIAESPDASAAADVLTAELSGHKNLQLLERNEIERVYREQGLSAGNKDYLKLGQILGADGLLLMETAKEGAKQILNVRLIAVKPGVVLVAEKFSWPMENLTEWSPTFAKHLDLFLPKLSVLVKDAVPISVVNLRSAIQSDEAKEAERELKLLAIQRLSREPQFFVLERQKLQLLTEEKNLKLDDSAFWNGSYLLEGVVDQNGYSKETITINARLTPPKGGAPVLIQVSGSRTNLAEVINQLAVKVSEALKINSAVKEWNAADEAAQYFDEAQWALRWGIYSEAQAAAESAWALGKRDLDCASLRIRTYVSEVPLVAAPGVAYFQNGKKANYVQASEPLDPKYCDVALYALKYYYEFSRTSPDGEPKILTRGKGLNDWHNSDWYQLGIDTLVAASSVLEHHNYLPASQKPIAEKLTELRALARSVADLISKSPSVHDSYFVGDRIATSDELAHTMEEKPNIFRCKVDWGCLWQESPEDEVALYRELMSSPVFYYIHNRFWLRDEYYINSDAINPPSRLVAWNEADQMRIPIVWNNFVQELNVSTNVLLRLEAKALQLADTTNEAAMAEAFTNFFKTIFENRDALVANPVQVVSTDCGVDDLVNAKTGRVVTDITDSLQHLYHAEYRSKLEAMDQEYWNKTVPAQKTLAAFGKQKQYLKENKPYDFLEYVNTFREKNYSKAQALEIQPLVANYKSNLVAQSQNASGLQKNKLNQASFEIGQLEDAVDRSLNPPTAKPRQPAQAQTPKPAPIAKPVVVASALTNAAEIITNVLTVNKFLKIPLDGLEGGEISGVKIIAHHWLEGKLLLDFQYSAFFYSTDENGIGYEAQVTRFAIAILDPEAKRWEVIGCPAVDTPAQNSFYHRSVLLRGELFTSDGEQIKKYDFQKRHWQDLEISGGDNYQLFVVNDRLYAANPNMIFEIIDGGKTTHILASTRRRPPVSVLDTKELGMPILFEGPGHSLRVSTKNKIFTLTGNDWHEDSAMPPSSFPPAISPDGVLFAADGFNQPACVSFLATESNAVEFCLGEQARPMGNNNFSRPGATASYLSEPLWKLPDELYLAKLRAACHHADLYVIVDHSEARDVANDQHLIVKKEIVAKDGYNAALLCFCRDLPLPQKLFLKFAASDGCPPVAGIDPSSRPMFPNLPPGWMLFTSNFLFLGLETGHGIEAGNLGIGYKAGIWMIPIPELESSINEQKRQQVARASKEKKLNELRRQAFLLKYDRNHNGKIDSDEEDAAVNDPYFIKYRIDQIRAQNRQ